jgi:hypothetical protein
MKNFACATRLQSAVRDNERQPAIHARFYVAEFAGPSPSPEIQIVFKYVTHYALHVAVAVNSLET